MRLWHKDFDLICWLRIKNDFGKRVLIEVQRQLGVKK